MSSSGTAATTTRPFYTSDLEIVVVDPHRPGHELAYFPGEVNLRRADVVVINKVDTAALHDIETVRQNIRLAQSQGDRHRDGLPRLGPKSRTVKGKHVLVVEDGPTLTHGEMPYGAGVVAARQCGAAELSILARSPSAPSADLRALSPI